MPKLTRRDALILSAAALTAPALAQTVTQNVRLIVPFAPGGTVDLLARILAEGITPGLGGRSIVVENRSGAGTFIAMQALVQAPPDGHTLAIAANSVLGTAPILPGATMTVDVDRALVPVVNLIRVPVLLVAGPHTPFATLAELIAFARAHPGRLNIGHTGMGSMTHLTASRLAHEAGIRMELIQYRGGTPALLDVMSGHCDLYFSLLPESLPFIREGRLRPIAFASAERNPHLPEVPLLQDDLPGFTTDVAYGLVMAAGTPPAWIGFWNRTIAAFMDRPEVKARMEGLLWIQAHGTPEAYRQEIQAIRAAWAPVIRAAGIRAGG
ncbi:MAG: tripartite tricarboxylate transporter substrate binding protein [Rhodovarius sp.]|nr:tripartite tricarboxylate transporter substrate binding protein [Rhodovarius sp.]